MYTLYTLYIFVLYYYYVNVDYTIILTELNYIQYMVEDGRALISKYWKEISIKTTRVKYGTGPFLGTTSELPLIGITTDRNYH